MKKPWGKALYVEWIDSCCTNGWLQQHDIEAAGAVMTCQSLGFLVKETKDAIVLALNRSTSENTARPYGELVTIPKVAILKRTQV